MLVLDAALVRADQPPLEQRGDHVDARHDLVRRFRPALDDGDLVLVAGRRQPGVAVPSVGVATQPKHPLQAQGTDAVLLAGDRTTSPGTTSATACASPRRLCRPSATSLQHMPGSETPHAPLPTAPQSLRIAGKRTPPANAAAGRSPGIPPRCGTTYPSPGTWVINPWDRLSPISIPNVTRRPNLGEGDTQYAKRPQPRSPAPAS